MSEAIAVVTITDGPLKGDYPLHANAAANSREFVRHRAARRIVAITQSTERIQRKLKDDPKRSNAPGLRKRLAEYEQSLELLEFELKTGRVARLKGDPSEDGVSAAPATGAAQVEGH